MATITPFNINAMQSAMVESARILIDEMTNRTNNGRYPSTLPESMYADAPRNMGNNKYGITIHISHPAAPAYEFGSGLHGPKGEKYIIAPKQANALNIPFSRWPDFVFPVKPGKRMIGYNESGEGVLLRSVEHPGIVARPFVIPSIQARKQDLAKLIKRNFIASIGSGKRERIKIEVKI